VLSPRVEVNEGDLLLTEERPVLTALTPGPREAGLGDWVLQMLGLDSGEREPKVCWGKPALAWSHLKSALAQRPKYGCDAVCCRDLALRALNTLPAIRQGATDKFRAVLEAD